MFFYVQQTHIQSTDSDSYETGRTMYKYNFRSASQLALFTP